MSQPWLTAIGLVFVIEGLAYALFPALIRRLIAAILAMEADQLRVMGAGNLAMGVAIVWLVQRF